VRTVDSALRQHGLTGLQLLRLSRTAARDALARHGAYLSDERFDELSDFMLEIGCRYSLRFEPGHGIAIQTYLYRIMRRRYPDWLRRTLGDSRYPGRTRRIPPGGQLWPLDESDAPYVDPGFADVEERLSREAVEPVL
jgi:hypothetical protein